MSRATPVIVHLFYVYDLKICRMQNRSNLDI